MTPITATVKVMQNNTICLALPIRKKMGIKPGDELILSFDEQGEIKIMKSPKNWEDFAGTAKNAFSQFGGGEAFLKSERESWDK